MIYSLIYLLPVVAEMWKRFAHCVYVIYSVLC